MNTDAGAESLRVTFAWGVAFGRSPTHTDYAQEEHEGRCRFVGAKNPSGGNMRTKTAFHLER